MSLSSGRRHVRWAPGPAVALVRGPVIAIADAIDVLGAIDAGSAGDIGLDDVLEAMMSRGLASLGSFAMLELEPGLVRILVRGAGRAEIGTRSGVRTIDGSSARTWVEETIPDVVTVSLTVADGGASAASWWVSDGLVPADTVVWSSQVESDDRVAPAERETTGSALPAFSQVPPQAADPGLPIIDHQATPSGHTQIPQEEDHHDERYEGDEVEEADEVDEVEEADEVDDRRYDVMFAGTRAKLSVEYAAVREPEDAEAVDEPAAGDANAGVAEEPGELPTEFAPREAQRERAPEASAETPAAAAPAHAPTEIISFVPGVSREPGNGSPDAAEQTATPDPNGLGDHFNDTVAPRRNRRESTSPPVPSGALGGPTVRALVCAGGHANPVDRGVCRACAAALTADPIEIPRPVLGRLRVPGRADIVLDRPVVLGRNPRVESRTAGEMPRVEELESWSGVSRTHLIIRLEGWHVVAEDLGSSNGSFVTLPGQEPRRLRSGEHAHLEPGSVLDLAGEVEIVYEFD